MSQYENRWKDEARNVDEDDRRDVRDRNEFGRGAYGAGGYPRSDYENGGSGGRDPGRRWGSDWGHAERGWHRDDRGSDGRMRGERHRDEPIGMARERNFWEQAGDEVASWFGNDDAERRRQEDERRAQFRGRGPRGYTRSDERIRDDLNDRLTEDPYLDATDIAVSVSGGEVTLDGTVDDRMAKRRAEDLADAISGVRHVQNNLRLREPGGTMAF
ncbi:BON domain-containing protein [Azospirillum formosense]|uniref:BON domain-containing protein n=2 Tax=Azospirillum TaxID=191 RepID=A0ABX2KZH7_9PROT|nr:BON domain-containing protein [Azospirillum formosense]MBY3755682.1 BON domain-containing protein [Azospirillum formosense]NUB18958.1 BON domain-containing protein [Azospirillum formosense]